MAANLGAGAMFQPVESGQGFAPDVMHHLLSVHRLPALRLSLGVQVPPVLERSHVERLLALAFQIPSNSNLQMCMKNPTELVALDAPLNAMFGQMAHGTAGGLKKMGEMYLIVQLYTRLQFVNLSVVTIANIKDLSRRMDYLGDFGDGLGHSPYILGSMQPKDHLRGALNLARGVIMQEVFDGAVDLPYGGDVALVADYLMEMQVAATSISAYNPGLVGRGIWEGAEICAGGGGGGGGNVDSAEEMGCKGEVVMAGLRAAYQKRFEQELGRSTRLC